MTVVTRSCGVEDGVGDVGGGGEGLDSGGGGGLRWRDGWRRDYQFSFSPFY